MQIGERLNLSTFGAIDDESKAGNLYNTFRVASAVIAGNLGGNTDSFVPYLWTKEFFVFKN